MSVLLMCAGAFASTLKYVVPGPNGTVAGQNYHYWLKRAWEFYFTSPAPGPGPCQTVTVNGESVAVLPDMGGGKITCRVPAGRPIYINELSTHCSTLPGDHPNYGTTDPDLRKCSRQVTTASLITVWLDGQRVPDLGRTFWAGTQAFSVNIPPGRFPGVSQQRARAAAWGWGLLLRKLPKGTHTVKCQGLHPNRKLYFESDITIHVR